MKKRKKLTIKKRIKRTYNKGIFIGGIVTILLGILFINILFAIVGIDNLKFDFVPREGNSTIINEIYQKILNCTENYDKEYVENYNEKYSKSYNEKYILCLNRFVLDEMELDYNCTKRFHRDASEILEKEFCCKDISVFYQILLNKQGIYSTQVMIPGHVFVIASFKDDDFLKIYYLDTYTMRRLR